MRTRSGRSAAALALLPLAAAVGCTPMPAASPAPTPVAPSAAPSAAPSTATSTATSTAPSAAAAAIPSPRAEDTEVWSPVPPVVDPGPGPQAPAPPPADAVVLFDGRSLDAWESATGGPAGWRVADGVMTVVKPAGDIRTRRRFGSYQLHLEWRVPADISGSGQLRGNGGLFLGEMDGGGGYELQLLDSYRNATYVNGMVASVYKQYAPLANAMRPPREWQVFDVVWTAPTFDGTGALRTPASLTAFHNGVLVQDHVVLRGPTQHVGPARYERAHGALPILLQAHGDPSAPLSFRNVWVRELR